MLLSSVQFGAHLVEQVVVADLEDGASTDFHEIATVISYIKGPLRITQHFAVIGLVSGALSSAVDCDWILLNCRLHDRESTVGLLVSSELFEARQALFLRYFERLLVCLHEVARLLQVRDED